MRCYIEKSFEIIFLHLIFPIVIYSKDYQSRFLSRCVLNLFKKTKEAKTQSLVYDVPAEVIEGYYKRGFKCHIAAGDHNDNEEYPEAIEKYAEAKYWYTKAAQYEHVEAQNALAYLYSSALGGEGSVDISLKIYKKLAKMGHPEALNALGCFYATGSGVRKSWPKAFEHFTKAAEQGNIDARLNLGLCYINGYGVRANRECAISFYRSAAEQEPVLANDAMKKIVGGIYPDGLTWGVEAVRKAIAERSEESEDESEYERSEEDYVTAFKHESYISVRFYVGDDIPLNVGNNMNAIKEDADMNGYGWEVFLTYYILKYAPDVAEGMDADPEAGMYTAYYDDSPENWARAEKFVAIIKELIENEDELYRIVREEGDEIFGTVLPIDFPHFRYHRNVLHTGAVIRSSDVCPVCKKKRGYAYFSEVFTEDDEEHHGLCPWCIQDGSAARKFNGFAPDPYEFENIEQSRVDELTKRTPLMETFQDIIWPTHCDDFYEFIDYIWQWDDLVSRGIEKEIIEDLKENSDYSVDDLKDGLGSDSCMRSYLFRCLHCGKHHLYVDLD